ncbi:LexA family protein [Vreelandella piezotolerans]|uniref:LexA family protein n=1 Tax=Vreelandella piezotolerans TaxID=2609667 RepID=UPI0037AF6D1A
MRLKYLGPLAIGIDHPALLGVDCDGYSPNCFAVEVGPEAGVHGAVIEGDVLVVDESHSLGHDDLVVVEMDDALYLYKAFRVGARYRLMPLNGGNGLMATARMVRGVVVQTKRCSLAKIRA